MTDTTANINGTSNGRRHGLAARYYTDPDVFALELDRVFARNWVMVGHKSEVAEPGTVITAMVGDESVLVTNDGGTLRAMYNVCQHRGHQLVTSERVCVDRITCNYHAWTYGLDGRLLHARGEDVGELCVPGVRLDFQGGFMFVNLDPDAVPLAEAVPGVEEELLAVAPDAPDRVLAARLTHELGANWKVVVENYNECYHCPNIHKWFTSGVAAPGSYQIASGGQTIRHAAAGPEDPDDGYQAFFTWPVSAVQSYPGQVINTFRWVPLAVDRTLLIREWWLRNAEPDGAEAALINGDWNNTVPEDFGIVESVQRGLSSRGYRPGPLIEDPSGVCGVHSENSVSHLQDLLLESLGETV